MAQHRSGRSKGDRRTATVKRQALGQLAYRIKDQAQLDRILASAAPQLRPSILGLIKPMLRFKYTAPAASAEPGDV